jgi:hypothetical protein
LHFVEFVEQKLRSLLASGANHGGGILNDRQAELARQPSSAAQRVDAHEPRHCRALWREEGFL